MMMMGCVMFVFGKASNNLKKIKTFILLDVYNAGECYGLAVILMFPRALLDVTNSEI